MARLRHLSTRFVTSLWPGGPGPERDRWARSHLLPAEESLWERMPGRDRRHAVAVAGRVERALGDVERPVVAAALLHDVGKIDSHLGIYTRVVATVLGAVFGTVHAREWSRGSGVARRIGLYLRHPEIGAEMLALAGSELVTVAWAAQHHLPEAEWSVPAELGRVLKEADDD